MPDLTIEEHAREGGPLPEITDIPSLASITEAEVQPPVDELTGAAPEAVLASAGVGYYADLQAMTRLGQGPHEFCSYWGWPDSTPWCALFVAWCVDTCSVGRHDKTCAWKQYGGVAASGAVLAWGNALGKTLAPGATPQTGDFYVVDGHEHVGIVRGASATELYQSINGNWGGVVGYATWTHVSGNTWTSPGEGTHQLSFIRW